MKATKIIGRAVFIIFKSLINLDLLDELPVAHKLHAGHLHGIASGFTAHVFRCGKYQMQTCNINYVSWHCGVFRNPQKYNIVQIECVLVGWG
jgi:hypothetical protein